MSISSTAVMNASHVVQFSYIFDNEIQWMNAEFFRSKIEAYQFVEKMKPFWMSSERIEGEGWRIIETD